MKKLLNLGALCLLAGLYSCKEKDVLIDFGLKEGVSDTTYTTTAEASESRNVLIEEFTGASCTNCPDGHVTIANLINANPERIISIAYHTNNPGGIFKPVNKPGEKSLYDFRDSAATNIGDLIYGGLKSIPTAGIDRVVVGADRLIGRNLWASESNKRLLVQTPVNMMLTSEYKQDENKIVINVKIKYTKTVSLKNSLTIGVVESNIIDAQEYPDHVDMNYVHNHVFRKCLTTYNGYPVLDSIANKQPGRVYEYKYIFTPAPSWKLENCKIVAFISNNEVDNKEVLQAKEVKVK